MRTWLYGKGEERKLCETDEEIKVCLDLGWGDSPGRFKEPVVEVAPPMQEPVVEPPKEVVKAVPIQGMGKRKHSQRGR